MLEKVKEMGFKILSVTPQNIINDSKAIFEELQNNTEYTKEKLSYFCNKVLNNDILITPDHKNYVLDVAYTVYNACVDAGHNKAYSFLIAVMYMFGRAEMILFRIPVSDDALERDLKIIKLDATSFFAKNYFLILVRIFIIRIAVIIDFLSYPQFKTTGVGAAASAYLFLITFLVFFWSLLLLFKMAATKFQTEDKPVPPVTV